MITMSHVTVVTGYPLRSHKQGEIMSSLGMVFSLSNIRRPPIFIVIVSLKKIESNVKCSPWAQASVH